MRLFITGGTGFLGRELCETLRGHELLLLTRDRARVRALPLCRVIEGDLRDVSPWKNELKDFRPEACVHLAWEGLPDYSLATCSVNFGASLRLLRTLHEIGCPRFVGGGTCWEYGSLNGRVSEDRVPESVGQFAAFKTAIRLAAETFFSTDEMTIAWARIFFVYGPGQRAASLIPSTMEALLAGRVPEIRSPDALNDSIHVKDVAAGLAALATRSGPGGIYNLGSGTPRRVRYVVNLIAKVMNRPEVFPPSTEPGQGFWADRRHIHNLYGWEPRIPLEAGIRQMIESERAMR